ARSGVAGRPRCGIARRPGPHRGRIIPPRIVLPWQTLPRTATRWRVFPPARRCAPPRGFPAPALVGAPPGGAGTGRPPGRFRPTLPVRRRGGRRSVLLTGDHPAAGVPPRWAARAVPPVAVIHTLGALPF